MVWSDHVIKVDVRNWPPVETFIESMRALAADCRGLSLNAKTGREALAYDRIGEQINTALLGLEIDSEDVPED